ncbi:DMT family transporter [Alphaproteobacteria bacterium]|nr:DMT family transporter [Alphaproteobacteria bacterium]
MLRSQDTINIAALILLALLWSSSFPAIKIAVDTTGPMTLVALRGLVGLLVVAIIVALQSQFAWRDYLSYLPRIFVMSIFGMSLPFYLISRAEIVLEASLTGLLMSVGPLLTITGAHFFLKNEKLSMGSFVGVMTGFMGVVIIFGNGISSASMATLEAQLMVVLATVCYVISNLMARHMPEVPTFFMTVAMLFFLVLLMLPLALIFEAPSPQTWSPTIWAAGIWLGLFPTGLAFTVRFYLIKRAGAGFTAYVGYLIPMFSVLLGALILQEALSAEKMLAVVLIVAGLAISRKWKNT